MKTPDKIEFGDFQTPLALAREVCALLLRQGVEPGVVVEPTCGVGAFLLAASETFPKARLLGWDINPDYVRQASAAINEAGATGRARVGRLDFFAHDWETELAALGGELLLLGNPPWVTNAAVSMLNGTNLPTKRNLHGLRGIEARTGKSNFDISEWMLIQLIRAVRGRNASLAMLCKTATARKALRFAWQNDGRIASASLYRIDAKRHFGASVDACLLLARTGQPGPLEAPVFDQLTAAEPRSTFGLAGRDLVADIRVYRKLRHLEGLCPYQWRSGLKHDCGSVMELEAAGPGFFRNKLGQEFGLESDFVFPLLKCSDLAKGRVEARRFVLVPQRRVNEDTGYLERQAPQIWRYLDSHRRLFADRKSSIYKNRPAFAIFGVGDYAFAPWKVAVSGLHLPPRFVLLGPVDNRPVMLDDTCYFLPFASENEAKVVANLLNSPPCQRFIASLTFGDSKRPVTVDLLQRLNFAALAQETGLTRAWQTARNAVLSSAEYQANPQPELVLAGAARND